MQTSFESNVPIYVQIVDKIKRYIISGEGKAGERLPSVREFAAQMQVNPNTVQKALTDLEESGLIYTERTNGKFITQDSALIAKVRGEYASALVEKYLQDMQNIGVDRKKAIDFLKNSEKKE